MRKNSLGDRLSILLDVPAKHKGFMAAPLIGPVDAERYLATGQFEQVLFGGENYASLPIPSFLSERKNMKIPLVAK